MCCCPQLTDKGFDKAYLHEPGVESLAEDNNKNNTIKNNKTAPLEIGNIKTHGATRRGLFYDELVGCNLKSSQVCHPG